MVFEGRTSPVAINVLNKDNTSAVNIVNYKGSTTTYSDITLSARFQKVDSAKRSPQWRIKSGANQRELQIMDKRQVNMSTMISMINFFLALLLNGIYSYQVQAKEVLF